MLTYNEGLYCKNDKINQTKLSLKTDLSTEFIYNPIAINRLRAYLCCRFTLFSLIGCLGRAKFYDCSLFCVSGPRKAKKGLRTYADSESPDQHHRIRKVVWKESNGSDYTLHMHRMIWICAFCAYSKAIDATHLLWADWTCLHAVMGIHRHRLAQRKQLKKTGYAWYISAIFTWL